MTFAWSVSDENIAVLRDDYPGTTARSLVALSEGYVTVTVTGPLGKWYAKPIFVLPIDEFDGSKPGDDTGKPPTFDKPKPWRIDVGGIVGGFLVDWLFKPFLRPFLDDEGKEWLDGFGNDLKEWIKKALKPVSQVIEWVVDGAEWLMSEVSRAVAVTQTVYDQFLAWLWSKVLPFLIQAFFGPFFSILFPTKPKQMTISADGLKMLKACEGKEHYKYPKKYLSEPAPTIGFGHYMCNDDTKDYVTDVLVDANGIVRKFEDVDSGKYTVDENKCYVIFNGVKYGKQYNEMSVSVANQLCTQDANWMGHKNLDKFLKDNGVTLNQWQWEACLIDMYQKGIGDWPKAPIADYIKAKNYSNYDACLQAFKKSANGNIPIDGLAKRRTAEARLFYYHEYNFNPYS